jgi:hypothetical protein
MSRCSGIFTNCSSLTAVSATAASARTLIAREPRSYRSILRATVGTPNRALSIVSGIPNTLPPKDLNECWSLAASEFALRTVRPTQETSLRARCPRAKRAFITRYRGRVNQVVSELWGSLELGPFFRRRYPEAGAVQPDEGSRVGTSRNRPAVCAQDPSPRVKSGFGRDDALEEMKTVEHQTHATAGSRHPFAEGALGCRRQSDNLAQMPQKDGNP